MLCGVNVNANDLSASQNVQTIVTMNEQIENN